MITQRPCPRQRSCRCRNRHDHFWGRARAATSSHRRVANPIAYPARTLPTPWQQPGSGGSSPPHPVPQAGQFAPDAPVAPARVLPRQLLHQRADLGRGRRPSRPVRVGPILTDQAPVPGQQCARCHDPVQPQLPWQQPCQGGDHGTVSPVRLGRATCRRKTVTACRSTRISASFAASSRASSTSQPNTRTMKR